MEKNRLTQKKMLHNIIRKRVLILLVLCTQLSGCFTPAKTINTLYDYIGNPENAESDHGDRNYVELRNGEKIYGGRVEFTEPRGSMFGVEIDKKFYSGREVNSVYYEFYYLKPTEYGFAKRIMRGRLNVYTLYGNYGSSVPYFIQRGETGEMKHLQHVEDLREYLKDCPVAMEIYDEGNANGMKMKKDNNHYLGTAIYRYNNNECGTKK